MFVNETVKTYYQMFARQCGCWSTAHSMRKRGYTLEQCREVLDESAWRNAIESAR